VVLCARLAHIDCVRQIFTFLGAVAIYPIRVIQRFAYPTVLLFALACIVSRIWVTEDAFITFRMVENLYSGSGYTFNPGENVEASTHPLWAAVLIIVRGLGAPIEIGSVGLGLLFSLVGIGLLLRRSARAGAIPFAVLALCSMSGFRDFATSGLEFSLTFLLIVLFYQELDRPISAAPFYNGFLLSLMYLNRPETGLFYVYYSVFLFLEVIRQTDRSVASRFKTLLLWAMPTLIPIAYHVFRWFYFDALFQNPYYAKAGLSSNVEQGLKYLANCLLYSPGALLALLLLAGGIALHKPRSLLKPVEFNRLLRDSGLFVILTIYVIRVGGDFMAFRLWLPEAVMLCLLVDRFFLRLPESPLFQFSPAKTAMAYGVFLMFALIPTPTSQGYIADEREIYLHMGAGRVIGWQNSPWAVRGHEFGRLQECLGYETFWITNSQAHARCLQGVGLGYVGLEAGPLVKIFDEQALSDRGLARKEVLLRFRPGHEHYATFEDVLEKGVLFCSTGEPDYDRAMATNAGIVIRLDPELLATMPGIRARLADLLRLKREGSGVIPRLEARYKTTVEELYLASASWESDTLMQTKNACWANFNGGPETYFY